MLQAPTSSSRRASRSCWEVDKAKVVWRLTQLDWQSCAFKAPVRASNKRTITFQLSRECVADIGHRVLDVQILALHLSTNHDKSLLSCVWKIHIKPLFSKKVTSQGQGLYTGHFACYLSIWPSSNALDIPSETPLRTNKELPWLEARYCSAGNRPQA